MEPGFYWVQKNEGDRPEVVEYDGSNWYRAGQVDQFCQQDFVQVIGPAGPVRFVPLAKKHTGMRIDASGVLLRVGGRLKFGAQEMHKHLNEMAQRFYSGDITVVDEFLQLYCLDEHRPKNESSNNVSMEGSGS
jgi:hypothetical protein